MQSFPFVCRPSALPRERIYEMPTLNIQSAWRLHRTSIKPSQAKQCLATASKTQWYRQMHRRTLTAANRPAGYSQMSRERSGAMTLGRGSTSKGLIASYCEPFSVPTGRNTTDVTSSYVLLGYFIKYLDQTNYSNAFVSGMQEELGLYGNERNLLNTYFNIGIILGTIPAQMIQLKWVRPSIWIPACELAWSALTMVMASAKNVETVRHLPLLCGLYPDRPLSCTHCASALGFSNRAASQVLQVSWGVGTERPSSRSAWPCLSRRLRSLECSADTCRLGCTLA